MIRENIKKGILRIKLTGRRIQAQKSINQRKKWLKNQGFKYRRLNRKQRNEVRSLWGKNSDFDLHEIFYTLFGCFDPAYCPYCLMLADVGIRMNNQEYVTAWDDKNYYEILFKDIAQFPKSLIHNVGGVFMDENYCAIDEKQAIKIIQKEKYVIIKPSIETGDGKGVRKITPSVDDIASIFRLYKEDYIVQSVVKQYDTFALLNPTSVNVIRFNSVSLDGRVIPLSAGLRCGAPGAITDNSVSKDGGGMFMVGINDGGYLKERGYYMNGLPINKTEYIDNFSRIQVPNFENIKNLVIRMHERMPMFMFIGFDIVVDENSAPIVMEYNLKGPGVFQSQYANGPLFGTHTDDVIRYLRKKRIIK